jgi:membrane protein DedA with SNARE-associated domain
LSSPKNLFASRVVYWYYFQMNDLFELIARYGYTLLFFGVLGEQLGLPLPAGLLIFAVGAAAGQGELNGMTAFVLGVVACLLSDNFWFQMGLRKGKSVLPLACRISLNPDFCIRRTQNIFSRYGTRALLIVKFFPGANTIAAPFSGIMHMKTWRFILYDGLGACLWVGAFLVTGYLLSDGVEKAVVYFSRIGAFFWVFIFGAIILFIVWKYARRRQLFRRLRLFRSRPEKLKSKPDGP